MQARLVLPALVFSLLIIIQNNCFAESPWPSFRHDLKNTARTDDYTGPAHPILKWVFDEPNDGITSSPTIGHNGTIYVGAGGYYGGGGDSALYAINPDGTMKWKYKTDKGAYSGGIFASPTIGPDGTIYFGAFDHHMYALEDSVSYAKLKWKNDLTWHQIYCSAALSDENILYVGGLDLTFNALDAATGELMWKDTVGWCILSSPAIRDDGLVYVGCKDHNLYAYDDLGSDYNIVWSYAAGIFYEGHLFDTSPAIGPDGTVYIGCDQYGAWGQEPVPIDTAFYAVNSDGTLKWAFVVGEGVESSAAIGRDNMVYFGSYDSCLYALEDIGTEGVLRWKFKTDGPIDASPTIGGDGTIYIGSRDTYMYAINPDGTERWRFKTDGGIESSATIDDSGNLLFGSFDGNVYALGTGAPDLGVDQIELPDTVARGSVYYPSVSIHNYRMSVSNALALCEISHEDTLVYSDTVDIVFLRSGESSNVLFDPWTVAADSGSQLDVTATVLVGEDDNHVNDSLAVTLEITASADYICGDVNSSGEVDIDDITYMLGFVFLGGPGPLPIASGDVDCNSTLDIDDIVEILVYIFIGGVELCSECPG